MRTIVAIVSVPLAFLLVIGGVWWYTAAWPGGAAHDEVISPRDRVAVDALMRDAEAAMLRPAAKRPSEGMRTLADHVANSIDTPDATLHPTSVKRDGTVITLRKSGTLRHCADWILSYNTGPSSSSQHCFDLTLHGGTVNSVTPITIEMHKEEASQRENH